MEEQDEAEITAKPLFFISWTLTTQCPQWPGYLSAYKGEEVITDFQFFFFFLKIYFILFYVHECFCLNVCLCTTS